MTYNHYNYMKQLAEEYKPIGHTNEVKRFYTATGLKALEGLVQSLSNIKNPVLVAFDSNDFTEYEQEPEHILGRYVYNYVILVPLPPGKLDEIAEAVHNCKTYARELSHRIRHDAYKNKYGLTEQCLGNEFTFFELGSIYGFYGVVTQFSIEENVDFNLNKQNWA